MAARPGARPFRPGRLLPAPVAPLPQGLFPEHCASRAPEPRAFARAIWPRNRPFTETRENPPMARAPNYNQQRADRDRAKQAKADAKQREREQRKAEREAAAASGNEATTPAETDEEA